MNWKVFFITFATIFLAEIFDKTELAIFSLSMKEEDKMAVFMGAMFAFFIATLLAVILGGFLSRFIEPKIIRYVSAFIFLAIGLFIIFGKF
jgi:putative Ca2+/H+ antiporter (TMEM165/GDT1 family)